MPNRRLSGILPLQDGAGPPPDYLLLVQPAANGLAADVQAIIALEQQGYQGAAPAAAQEAEGPGRLPQDPSDHQVTPALAQADRGPAGLPEQGGHAALLEAGLPAGDGAAAAKQDGADQHPGRAFGQQQDDVGAQAHLGVGGAAEVVEQDLAFPGCQGNTVLHGLASVVMRLLPSTAYHRAKPFWLATPTTLTDPAR